MGLRNFRTQHHKKQERHIGKEISIGRKSVQVCSGNRRHGVLASFTAEGSRDET
jgi:hypothetical protein